MKLTQKTNFKIKFNQNLNFEQLDDRQSIFKLVAERAKLKALEAEQLLKQKFKDLNIKIPNVITAELLLKNQRLFLELMIIIDNYQFSSTDIFSNQTSNKNSEQFMYINRIYTQALQTIPLIKSFLEIRRSLVIKSSEQQSKVLEQFDNKSDTDLFFEALPPKTKKNKKNKKKKNKNSEQSTAHGDQIQSLLQKQNDQKVIDLISLITKQSYQLPIELSSSFLNNLNKVKEQEKNTKIKQSDKLQAVSQQILKQKVKNKKSK